MVCLECSNEFLKSGKKIYCNENCRKEYLRRKYKKQRDEEIANREGPISCKICGWKMKNLTNHLRAEHNKLTLNEYKKQYNLNSKDCFTKEYLNKLSEKIKGEKNPAWNHQGKFSALSKNFIKYEGLTEEEKEERIKQSSKKISISNKENGNNTTTLKYWLKQGYNEQEAQEKLSDRQKTFTLEKCIEKLGEEKGRQRWLKRQEKWQNTLNSKPSEERKRIAKAKMNNGKSYSKISQELFTDLLWKLKYEDNRYYFATLKNWGQILDDGKNDEFCLITNNNKIRFLDFYDKKLNKIIEFDGDYWHGVKRGNQERDQLREEEIIATINCKILHILEKDYKENPEREINKCLSFLEN